MSTFTVNGRSGRGARAHATAGALLTWMVLAPALCLAETPAGTPEGKSFVERFTTLDTSRWLVSSGWSNGEYQSCTWSSQNVRVSGRGLELLLTSTPSHERKYSCSEIQTHGFHGFGTFEVRMRPAAAPGMVTAFFTYTGPSHGAGRPHDEIDFEFLGRSNRQVQLNYFTNGKGEHGHDIALDAEASRAFNDYAFEWHPDRIRWYVNGRLVHEVIATPAAPLPRASGKIILSLWSGQGPDMESWLGRFEHPGAPMVAVVERVAFTRLGDACQFPDSIVCRQPSGERR